MSTSKVAGSMRILLYCVCAFVPPEAPPAVYCAKFTFGPTCGSERYSDGDDVFMSRQNACQGLFGSWPRKSVKGPSTAPGLATWMSRQLAGGGASASEASPSCSSAPSADSATQPVAKVA